MSLAGAVSPWITAYDARDPELFLIGASLVALGLAFMVMGGFFVACPKQAIRALRTTSWSPAATRVFGAAALAFATTWTAIAAMGLANDRADRVHALEARRYATAEGRISNFVPGSDWGHRMESFDVAGNHFEYGFMTPVTHFRAVSQDGGLIRAGVRVRVDYVPSSSGNEILRLDIAREDYPSLR